MYNLTLPIKVTPIRTLINKLISTLLSVICTAFFSTCLLAQLAPVNPPTGGFAIDGGLRANTPTSPSPFAANQGDWFPPLVATNPTGGSVFTEAGVPISPATGQTSGRANPADPFNGNDNIFANGSKFNDYVGALNWTTNSAPDKNDINNALYHVSRDPSNNQWIFISGDRLSTNGTSYIDFELLQGTISQNVGGTFTGTTATGKNGGGGRTENDIIISMEYTNGGSKPSVLIYQWKLSGSTWSYQQVTASPTLAANAFAETNRAGAELNLPYTAFGNTSYQQFAFVEAAVNITYLLNQTGLACSGLNIQTLWVKTKAAASTTAALKDFMTPIPVNFTFGSTTISPITPKCAGNNNPYLLSSSQAGGTFTGPGVSLINGAYYFTPSAAGGAGTKTINYASADGSCTATTQIQVIALPLVYTLSGNSICASASGTGVITLSSSQNAVTYQLKTTVGNNDIQSAQNGTGAALTWSSLPAGVNYYVVATGTAPPSCTSTTGNASVTEVTNPAVYNLTGNAICASAPNTGVLTLSNSQTGVSYQLVRVSDNGNVQNAKPGTTGSAITWTGIGAGVDYKVIAMGAGPTNCTSTTTNASVTEAANPTVYTLSGNAICATAPNTGVLTLNNSQNGVGYQLVKASDNSAVFAPQGGTAGSPLTWTGIGAGISYKVIATAAAPTSCTSNTANASVTEVANPVVYNLSGNSICASAPGTGIITLSNSQTGVSYQLKNAGTNGNVQVAQNGTTGSSLSWSGLSTGINYKVVATGAVPTNCTSTTANASITEVQNPDPPVAKYVAPTCTETTFKVEIEFPQTGTYTLTQLSGGVATQTKTYPAQATNGKIVFSNLTIGRGYSVALSANGCTSTADECGFSARIASNNGSARMANAEITIPDPASTQPTVSAYPNPFNDRLRFSLKSAVSGQGSLELYNMLGQKVKTVYQGYIEKGSVRTIEYSVPGAQRTNLIYLFRVGDQKTSGRLLGLK